jgi:hypothetical protein
MNWLLSLGVLDSTACLRFIDPYSGTVFNGLQIPVLQSELSALGSRLTETNLLECKRAYLSRAEAWPKTAIEEARKAMETLSIGELQQHLDQLLRLLSDAVVRGPHHYVRFVGD